MKNLKSDAKGISPVIATIILIAVTAVAGGIIAAYVATMYVPAAGVKATADVSGAIMDKNTATADNFVNGKAILEVKVMSDDIDDVLDPTNPMKITILGRGKAWSTGSIDIRDSNGDNTADLTEGQYGATFVIRRIIPVAAWRVTASVDDNNLFVKISVPTTSGGEVDEGMTIRIETWPTDVDVSTNVTTDAAFDSTTEFEGWAERDTIDIVISARAEALSLTGYDGAYLSGTEIDL